MLAEIETTTGLFVSPRHSHQICWLADVSVSREPAFPQIASITRSGASTFAARRAGEARSSVRQLLQLALEGSSEAQLTVRFRQPGRQAMDVGENVVPQR